MWYPDLLAVPVVGATAIVVAFGWFRHRERLAALAPADADPGALAARLAQLEAQVARVTQAVDAVAVEVERVGEGQRYLAAQLSERASSLAAAAGPPDGPPQARGRVVTPH
jgi:hypothetical protein